MSRIVLTIPDTYIEELNQTAKEEARSRSEIIREYVRAGMEARKRDKEFRKRQDQAFKTMDEIRESTKGKPHVNSTEIIRAMRGPIGKQT